MVARCEAAIKEYEREHDLKSDVSKPGHIELIDLRTLQPWDKDCILESVKKTGRCLIVHEDNRTAGFGAEIAAVLAHEAFFDLDAPVTRITMPDIPSPHNINLLNAALPSIETIASKINDLITI
jgi:2-oxoisovalerate dehydrogenase E1 component